MTERTRDGIQAGCVLASVAVLCVSLACGPAAAPVPTKVITITEQARCIDPDAPPPAAPVVPRPKCTDAGCTWTLEQSITVIDYVEALQDWVNLFWPLCQKVPNDDAKGDRAP